MSSADYATKENKRLEISISAVNVYDFFTARSYTDHLSRCMQITVDVQKL